MCIVDLSGYSYSGKSAYYQLFAPCTSVRSFGIESEFDLFRIPGGILDLFHALTDDNWSLMRSSHAIQKFRILISRLSGKRTLASRLFSNGLYYDDLFPGFTSASYSFISSIVYSDFKCYWPFDRILYDSLPICSKLLNTFSLSLDQVSLSRFSRYELCSLIHLYISSLFSQFLEYQNGIVLLNNAFETSSPSCCIDLCPHSYSIVIDRDPRAIFTSAYLACNAHNQSQAKAVIGRSTSNFITRYLMQRTQSSRYHPKCLNLSFEELMLSYESTINKLSCFLSVPSTFFNSTTFRPSDRNICPWKLHYDDPILMASIHMIQSELSSFCYL